MESPGDVGVWERLLSGHDRLHEEGGSEATEGCQDRPGGREDHRADADGTETGEFGTVKIQDVVDMSDDVKDD